MKAFLIKDYANMSDRVVKPISSTSLTQDYLYTDMTSAISGYTYQAKEGVNIDTKDGIETSFVVNWEYDWAPNFCYVCGGPSSEYNPVSGWYVTEFKKIRGKQYQVGLHRDVVGDKYRKISTAPCYIERAMVDDSNPLVLNSEGMQFNQIKKAEHLIKDKLDAYYYVAYIDKSQGALNITGSASDFPYFTVSSSESYIDLIKGSTMGSTQTNDFYSANKYTILFLTSSGQSQNRYYRIDIWKNKQVNVSEAASGLTSFGSLAVNRQITSAYRDAFCQSLKASVEANIDLYIQYLFSDCIVNQLQDTYKYAKPSEFDTISEFNNNIVYDNFNYDGTVENKYFTYNLIQISSGEESSWHAIETGTTNLLNLLCNNIDQALSDCGLGMVTSNRVTSAYKYQTYNVGKYRFNRTQYIPSTSFNITIPANRRHCQDAPYDVIIIPAYAGLGTNISITGLIDENLSKAIADAINIKGTSEKWLYDMQRIPYAPIYNESFIKTSSIGATWIDTTVTPSSTPEFLFVEVNNVKKAMLVFSATHKASFTIAPYFNYTIGYNVSTGDLTKTEQYATKVSNECDMYRLVSPNGAGTYEFNIPKNGGSIGLYNLDIALKPITPFIHIAPSFGLLYGRDFNDYRGLICGGDFSIATVTDAWLSYAQNNKMYQQVFDRQIENLDFNQKYQMLGQQLGAVTSSIGTGVGAGMMTGNVGIGLAAGAASAIGGIADTEILRKQQKESKDFTIDMFNLNLRNVQAQPRTLTKVGADDPNNKIWCTLEVYTCTPEEREAFKKKIQYNSMTVNAISNIATYRQSEPTFIQGRLIRCDNLGEDDHFVTVLKNEIMKGVYL